LQSITYKTNDRVTRTSPQPGRTRTLMNDKQWLRSCYCYHKLGHWGMTSSGYGRVTVVTNSDTEEWQAVATIVLLLSQTRTLMKDKSGYGRVTVVRNSDTEEWQAVTTVVLLLSHTRTLRNDKQWLRSCYCCHKLGHRGKTSSGYGPVTVVINSDIEEWQAVTTVVLLLSQTRTLRNDKQWLRSCYCCHKLGQRGMTSSGYDRVTVVTNSNIEEWQAVATVVLLLSQTRTQKNVKQWLRSWYCCQKHGDKAYMKKCPD
jgi:mRNA-degrading endonuclease toxin of MazEF toxin-antitoxin module